MGEVDKQYYTPVEASTMVPRLESSFGRILQVRSQLRDLYHQLEAAGLAPDDDAEEIDIEVDLTEVPDEMVRKLAMFKGLLETLRDDLEALAGDGIIVKDLESGLCDFYARFQGRDVLLCWRLGEKEVTHWHEIEGGYRGRRPVAELLRALPSRVR